MNQEVEIKMTISINASHSKQDIVKKIENAMDYIEIYAKVTSVREEAEIYGNK